MKDKLKLWRKAVVAAHREGDAIDTLKAAKIAHGRARKARIEAVKAWASARKGA